MHNIEKELSQYLLGLVDWLREKYKMWHYKALWVIQVEINFTILKDIFEEKYKCSII